MTQHIKRYNTNQIHTYKMWKSYIYYIYIRHSLLTDNGTKKKKGKRIARHPRNTIHVANFPPQFEQLFSPRNFRL